MIAEHLLHSYRLQTAAPLSYSAVYEYTEPKPDWQERTARLYSDGGVFRPRRCEAGSWAWVAVDEDGWMVNYEFGWVQANERVPEISNNQCEYLAMLRAVEAMPGDWGGKICSDSGVTIGRFSQGWKHLNIPPQWERRMQEATQRLSLAPGDYILHKGHPTRADIAAGEGRRKPGGRVYPVSVHQELCDRLCGLALELWSRHSGITR